MATLPKLDELTTDQIKYIIEEYNHQLTHLIRSQGELQTALEEEPGDEELTTAFNENIVVIERRKDLVALMIKYLEENDPFFDKSSAQLHRVERTTEERKVATRENQLNLQENEEDDRGMYI